MENYVLMNFNQSADTGIKKGSMENYVLMNKGIILIYVLIFHEPGR